MTELVRYESGALARPAVHWQDALATFLDTLGGPRTRTAYRRAIGEAMAALGISTVAEVTPPDLAHYRAGLVERLDLQGPGKLSPAAVSLKLASLRSFLHFCRLTGILPIPDAQERPDDAGPGLADREKPGQGGGSGEGDQPA